jgi:hypothetical protein
MTKDMTDELQKDRLRECFNKYTRKAFQMLPELDKRGKSKKQAFQIVLKW